MKLYKEKTEDIFSVIITLDKGECIVIDEKDILGAEQHAVVTIHVSENAFCTYYSSHIPAIKRVAHVSLSATMTWHEAYVCFANGESTTRTELLASGATGNMYSAIYLGKESQYKISHAVFHKAPQTTSNTLTRGIAHDAAKIIYHSVIDMDAHVDGAVGKQKADFLIASSKASVEAVPDLVIRHHAVQCSHGVSITKLSDVSLFYLTSRGLSEDAAKQALLNGHIFPMLHYIEDETKQGEVIETFQLAISEQYGQ